MMKNYLVGGFMNKSKKSKKSKKKA
jgi:hypothetical protein